MPSRVSRRDSHRRQFILMIWQIQLHCPRSGNDDQLFSESVVGMLDPGLRFAGDTAASTRPEISREPRHQRRNAMSSYFQFQMEGTVHDFDR